MDKLFLCICQRVPSFFPFLYGIYGIFFCSLNERKTRKKRIWTIGSAYCLCWRLDKKKKKSASSCRSVCMCINGRRNDDRDSSQRVTDFFSLIPFCLKSYFFSLSLTLLSTRSSSFKGIRCGRTRESKCSISTFLCVSKMRLKQLRPNSIFFLFSFTTLSLLHLSFLLSLPSSDESKWNRRPICNLNFRTS